MYELRKLAKEGIDGALKKAERYRLLNEPWEAESICRDVLEVEPRNQQATVGLILALSDQLGTAGARGFDEARALIKTLEGEYERSYYSGLLCERRAKSHFERGAPGCGAVAYNWYRQGMEWFEKADGLKTTGNEEAALRWNSCARMLDTHSELRPTPDDDFHPMLE